LACEQQNFLERIVSYDFIDQRIEKRPAADIQHRFRLRRGLVSRVESRARSSGQDDGLPQHSASPAKLQNMRPKSISKPNIDCNTSTAQGCPTMRNPPTGSAVAGTSFWRVSSGSLGQLTSFLISVRQRMDHILTEHPLAFNPRGRPIKNRDWHRY
jgi:hypothetical protein